VLKDPCAEHNGCKFCDPSCFYTGVPSYDTTKEKKMTKESFFIYMKSIQHFLAELDNLTKGIASIAPGSVCEVGYHFLDDYIKLLSEAAGDDSDWIEWYVFENEMGKRKLKAGYGGKEKKITNLDQLCDLIQEGKKK